jgi:hypothetical protein
MIVMQLCQLTPACIWLRSCIHLPRNTETCGVTARETPLWRAGVYATLHQKKISEASLCNRFGLHRDQLHLATLGAWPNVHDRVHQWNSDRLDRSRGTSRGRRSEGHCNRCNRQSDDEDALKYFLESLDDTQIQVFSAVVIERL